MGLINWDFDDLTDDACSAQPSEAPPDLKIPQGKPAPIRNSPVTSLAEIIHMELTGVSEKLGASIIRKFPTQPSRNKGTGIGIGSDFPVDNFFNIWVDYKFVDQPEPNSKHTNESMRISAILHQPHGSGRAHT
ncbi:MAG: hypothetical protein V2G42_07645 [bacterium JZ-2024 1]